MPHNLPPDSQETPLPVSPAQEGMLSVRGGVGGIKFQFEELLLGAAECDRLAGDLTALEYEERAIWDQLCFTERTLRQREARISCDAALDAIQASWQSVAVVRDQLHRMAADIRSSHRDYEAAEAWAAYGLRSTLGELPWLELPGGSSAVRFAARDVSESLMVGLGLLLGVTRGPAGGVASLLALSGAITGAGPRSAFIGNAVRQIVESPLGRHLAPRPVVVHQGRTSVEDLDPSAAGLLSRLQVLGETTEGEIEVVRLENGRQTSWVILIPGTQTSVRTGGSNPFDEAGIADAMGYGSQSTAAGIQKALREAGAKAGEQIAIAGYSQGGIHAMNLSQDKAFLAEFDVKFVLTAGSPVGGIQPGPGISSLHLEHGHDAVPAMDGLPNPDTKDRVTVTLENPLELPAAGDFGLGPGHRLSNYVEGAEAVADSSDASLRASNAALAGIVGAGGIASVTRFRLERVPKTSRPQPSGAHVVPAPRADVRALGGR